MALPAARYLKAEGWHVTWLCGKTVELLVQTFSGVDRILVVDDARLLGTNKAVAGLEFLEINRSLSGKKFDQIFIGHTDKRYHYLVAMARGPVRSFGTELEGSYIPCLNRHHSIEYLRLVSFRPPESIPRVEDHWPPALQPWSGQGSLKIAIAPGGARNLLSDDRLRRWPLASYAELTRRLSAAGHQVDLLGSRQDEWVLGELASEHLTNRLGEFDLIGMVRNLAQYEALITHDSGPLHLAGLARTPVIGLFGPTYPEWRMPYLNSGAGLRLATPLPCQPCYDGKHYAVCQANRCLSGLSVDLVLEKLSEVAARARAANPQI